MQRYLRQVLAGKAQSVYTEDTFKLVLMEDKKMDQKAQIITSTINAIEQFEGIGVTALETITRTSTAALEEYEKILVEMDKLLDRNISKYQMMIQDNSVGLNEYNENRRVLEVTIEKVSEQVIQLGGEV